jgi:hypothetical protein
MGMLYETLGDLVLYEHEGLWWGGVTLSRPDKDPEEYEVGGFETEGAALDGLKKWAEDRGLFLTSVLIEIRRLTNG